MDTTVVVADILILILVLVGPFLWKTVEHNLEAFLFIMGLAAAWIARVLDGHLVREALMEPIPITLAVFFSGLLFKWSRHFLASLVDRFTQRVSPQVLLAGIVLVLGLVSSVITAIIASLVLVEMVSTFRLRREDEARLVVVACLAIGLGAALTPVGEPLSTIATANLDQDFFFLLRLLGLWIIPGILALALATLVMPVKRSEDTLTAVDAPEPYSAVLTRALRVYLFVMALIFLGGGLRPVIEQYLIRLDAMILYWINMISAVVDNATLTAAEVGPHMTHSQVRAVLMGLLISGGMLIPGNIPNIIAANKLRIRSREWARVGVPLGLVLLLVYFAVLYFVG
ncbi:MAG: DUF1646 family protein [Armatimonadota bacterium]|nr:DUF1646 family protein [Armatimonadota bacterium]MDR7435305.1 DUF1646 family protein [Armatimonadota bacterium]